VQEGIHRLHQLVHRHTLIAIAIHRATAQHRGEAENDIDPDDELNDGDASIAPAISDAASGAGMHRGSERGEGEEQLNETSGPRPLRGTIFPRRAAARCSLRGTSTSTKHEHDGTEPSSHGGVYGR
jgi:hypothetical protein